MAIQIGAKPDSGFDDPIGMLKDCHAGLSVSLKYCVWSPSERILAALRAKSSLPCRLAPVFSPGWRTA